MSAEPQSPPPSPPNGGESPGAPRARGSTLFLTNLTKVVGIGLAINELVFRPEARDSAVILCAIFVLGVQATENVLLRIIDRLFGQDK